MAASTLRLAYNFLGKKRFSRCQCLIYTTAERHYRSESDSFSHENKRSSGNSSKGYITYSAIISSALAYALYQCNKEDGDISFSHFAPFPTVNASTNYFPTKINQNREKYNFIADVVEVTAPSVVYIDVKDQRRIDFYTGKPATTSNGSGFIVGEDGLILTNAHVVINKPNISVKVRLQDGTTYPGVVEDIDMKSDLATIRIDKTNLPVMKLGSSSELRPGEFVVAIGSPLNLSNTITSGIVSSVNRQSEELGLQNKTNMGYIQTDAAITFGNSGGPLVNLSGEAIGINAMKVTAGISFAIPIDYAKEFLKKSEERRKLKGSSILSTRDIVESTKRRYMGITMLTLTPDIIFELQQRNDNVPFSIRHGVLVWKVIVGSPAYLGGLRPGDILTHVNGEPITTAADIYKVLEKLGPLKLKIVRNSQVLEIVVDPEDG